ncbi:Holliday junction resolvase (modular protein) [Candidatus Competibacter denitrificans Run_A_D11]|uniref:Putative pre-16S rRNA nuclease n=1 Tax=Candidatus Competibacter denitrificans Run_A_D11 TaxID=1400863 RepID=W6M422_9GAMM|nr:Holliday junction resolvase RuvX [Candidatus Competibacter denitrificans]CDI02427.1 Holliday junction resolvase (modular protein) [Candidatus Competibacter denitrificans Run_A_D11]HAS86847.1 Holliday junction resolvase RuvX [Candidatus Competibacteraceae bacterium]HRC69864.1 Holliday junction resolvase RuvX [Candidatus Competibacter denitrificans]
MPATLEQGLAPAASRHSYRVALGFDFGQVRIGVAIGEGVTGSARPLGTLSNRPRGPDWDAIGQLLATWQPEILVVGVPRHADDSANKMTEAALRFSRQLHGRFRLPVATIDERLSSWEAGQQMQASATKRRRTKISLDAGAAAIILESWFNQQRSPGECAMSNS